jgi:hypothetical protein
VFIIESINGDGLVTTLYTHARAATPRPGDFVRWTDGTIGRVELVGTGWCEPDEAHVCREVGSAFLNGDGTVDISGGPFRVIPLTDLHTTYQFHTGTFWNWGDNRPGRDQGVHYQITRPIFDHIPTED